MTLKEAWKIFGFSKQPTESELKAKYRTLTLKYHPDVKKTGDTEYFKKITVAFDLIKAGENEEIKSKNNTSTSTSKPNSTYKSNVYHEERKTRRKRALDPQDIVIDINVSVQEIHDGFRQKLSYNRRKACENCQARGCAVCNGEIHLQQMGVEVYIHSTLMNSNDEIVYEGFGESTYENADLVLKLKFTKSKFNLEKSNKSDLPIITSIEIISEGQTELTVKTLDGNVKISLPEEHKDILKLKEKGLKFNTKQGIRRGDHYIYLKYNKNNN